jgi:hypothetical protein
MCHGWETMPHNQPPKVLLAKWLGLTRQAALTPSHSCGTRHCLRPCVFGAYDLHLCPPSFLSPGTDLSGE